AARAPDRGDAPSRPPSISGVVRTVEGLPIAGARVGLLGAALEATTDDDGRFTLVAQTVGTRMVAARAIGFRPGRTVVDVTAAEIAAVDIVLAPADPAGSETPTALDTVRVSGISRLASSAIEVRRAFSRRVQSGVGMFLGDSAIRARHLHLPSELFRGMPGLTVTNGSGGQGVYMRANATFNASKGLCLPTVFIDGGRAPRAPVDQMTTVSQLRAVEIYPRSEQAPPQFQTSDGCGVIVLWTRTMWDATASPPSR
ncbi:MAG TPA: carboxypeptidase regulatory-like domain-containing protein, partial [Gemmatimonadaceae bacterium]|nr:carboxypeptidase regulatory-like domain-containing protein [Gemmatimonadaceae bacterium]